MSTTPRTDNAWRRYNSADQPDPQELAKEMITLETELACEKENRNHPIEKGAKLETELNAMKAEFEKIILLAAQAADRNVELRRLAEKAEAELVQLRADRDYNHECINRLASATGTLGEKSGTVVDVALSNIDQLRAEVERLKGLASWANTCIHHNDAERARYGHVCLVCTSTRAEKAEKLWKEFITLMDITEESDSGNAFNPNKISSCRAMDGKRLNEILIEARQIVF